MNEPRTWMLTPEPEDVDLVRDRFQRIWVRDRATGTWDSPPNMRVWGALLQDNGPLTEVVETKVDAAARRLREAGLHILDEPRLTTERADPRDVRIVLAHVLNGGSL